MEEEQEFKLHSEVGHEAKRLATHPVQEVERLEREAAAGETDMTPVIVIGGVGLFVALVVAVVLVIGFTAGHLFGSLAAA